MCNNRIKAGTPSITTLNVFIVEVKTMKTKVTKVLASIMTSIMKLFKHANKIYWQFSMDHPVWLGFF